MGTTEDDTHRKEALTLKERKLVARARAGEREALREVYDRHAEDLYGVAYNLTRSAADARDVLQDVFVGLPIALGRFDGRSSLGRWLKRVTARRAMVALRTNRRRLDIATGDLSSFAGYRDPPDVVSGVALERALEALPEELRTVLVLKVIEGYTHDEIAELQGVRPATTSQRLARARVRLRDLLAE